MSKTSKSCSLGTSGGKGNIGMFIERDPQVFAAGVPSAQPNDTVKGALEHYLLHDEVSALVSDAIIPPEPHTQPTLRHLKERDMRNAGPFSHSSTLINPPVSTKFLSLVDDIKNTVYSSYWKKPLGTVSDQVPNLPPGLNIYETTLGKKTTYTNTLYDLVMPKDPPPQQNSDSKLGCQQNRNYCSPNFNRDKTFGERGNSDKRGKKIKCVLQDNRRILGTANYTYMNARQADHIFSNHSRVGEVLTPINNKNSVPKGFTFGALTSPDKIVNCMSHCRINTQGQIFRECLAHLNTLRKCLRKRFDRLFYAKLYRELKYYDTNHSGWLPKNAIYKYCQSYYIRFNPELIEPLLACWDAFNGSEIEYKTFVQILNHNEEYPELPKVWSVPQECLDYRTTYTEMMKPQEPDTSRMAGLPSGRYFDMDYPITPERYCRADRSYLPQETTCLANINPSVFTLLGVTHRDMFAERSPEVVKKVFKNYGEKITDEQFDEIWKEAKKYHSQGIVCFETFRKALDKYNASEK